MQEIIKILSSIPKGTTLEELEKAFILSNLIRNNGNKTHTCNDLKTSIRTLRNKLKRYEKEGYEIPIYRGKIINDLKI